MNKKISILSRILLVASAALLAYSLKVPIWQIDLDAPQYPEGLNLKIFAGKLGGDVEIINGLNHYIGMKTLHTEDFIEFTLLPYIIGFFAAFSLISAAIGQKKVVYVLFGLFVTFGIVAMIDFWRWEYNYGHDLDPHAAIIVPGMAYQPPLIGFKQLLNFGAYSIPDTGGWMFIGSGLLMLIGVLKESAFFSRFKKKNAVGAAVVALLTFTFTSCGNSGPEEIKLNKDDCDNCKMSISDKRFACEILTSKGRAYKFDDVSCLLDYKTAHSDKMNNASYYIQDYLVPNTLSLINALTFVKGENISSPMGGNIAAFTNKDSATVYATQWQAELTSWESIQP